MDRLEQTLAILGSLVLIAGITFYVATNVNCSKIPVIGGAVCVAH